MRSNLFQAWGKAAETLRKTLGQTASERPQNVTSTKTRPIQAVHKPPTLPTLYPTNTHSYPQQKTIKIPPLQSLFPTLSTEPITTRTN